MHRRAFLVALGSAAAAALSVSPAAATTHHKKVREIARDDRGVTFTLQLENAPFPAPGSPYADASTRVFVPRHYQAPRSGEVDMVVHFHGHNTTAGVAMRAHELREQLYDSKQNAILILPQGPVNASDGSGGKLEAQGGLARLTGEVLRVLRTRVATLALPHAGLGEGAGVGMVCLSAHSGGYRVTAACLRLGGVEVSEVYLFDALYGEVDAFRDWVLEKKDAEGRERHKLICHYAGNLVRERSLALQAALEARGVACDHETQPGELSRAELIAGRAVFIRSPLSHGGVTHEQNALRDCLFASGLRRNLGSRWFAAKDAPRRLDPRRTARRGVPAG